MIGFVVCRASWPPEGGAKLGEGALGPEPSADVGGLGDACHWNCPRLRASAGYLA
jgi:hypothetical protein